MTTPKRGIWFWRYGISLRLPNRVLLFGIFYVPRNGYRGWGWGAEDDFWKSVGNPQ